MKQGSTASILGFAALLATGCALDEADVDTAALLAEEDAPALDDDFVDDVDALASATPSAAGDPCPLGCNDPPTQCAMSPGQCIVDPTTGTGTCLYQPVFPGTACDSGNPCMVAECYGLACVSVWTLPEGSPCDDGLECTVGDSCQGEPYFRTCVGGDECAEGLACTPEGCAIDCDPELLATVGNLYYPGWTCEDAIANAESNLGMFHYRKACHQQVGSEMSTPVSAAVVTDCHIEGDSGQAVVTVELCCG